MANHIATTKPNAMTVYGEISPWREAANEEQGASFGTLLKFVKGDWLIGEEQEPVAPTATFIVNMEEYWRGWIKWLDKEPVDHRIGRVVDRHRVHLREELGDLDQSRWETDANGVPRDPWQRVSYLVMRNTSNDDIVTFTSTSDGGRKAVAKLADRYDRLRRKHLGKMPVVGSSAGGVGEGRLPGRLDLETAPMTKAANRRAEDRQPAPSFCQLAAFVVRPISCWRP
jgi:hypothetical protein